MRKIAAVLAALIAIAVAAPALAAAQCPITDAAAEKADGFANAVRGAVKAAPDCARACGVLSVCALGSSADYALAEMVRATCEPLFLPRAGRATKRAYKKALRRCAAIAENNEGSMYQGFSAVCAARAARDFARKRARTRQKRG